MITIVIILSGCLLAAGAFIFWLLRVLKNTFDTTENIIDIAANKISRKLDTAYDNKYYLATVIATIKFDCDKDKVITDFSQYKEKGVIEFIIHTSESIEKYYGNIINELDDQELKLLKQPITFKDVLVYAPRESVWTWKLME